MVIVQNVTPAGGAASNYATRNVEQKISSEEKAKPHAPNAYSGVSIRQSPPPPPAPHSQNTHHGRSGRRRYQRYSGPPKRNKFRNEFTDKYATPRGPSNSKNKGNKIYAEQSMRAESYLYSAQPDNDCNDDDAKFENDAKYYTKQKVYFYLAVENAPEISKEEIYTYDKWDVLIHPSGWHRKTAPVSDEQFAKLKRKSPIIYW